MIEQRQRAWPVLIVGFLTFIAAEVAAQTVTEFPVPKGSRPHDVAPAPDGKVWYTAQFTGELGLLDPSTGSTRHIKLGDRARPHGVIVGPDGAPWITDGGLNAIVRVDPKTEAITVYTLPKYSGYANMNTATFDQTGALWFTGQTGIYGRVEPATGKVEWFDSPRGRGPYGIATAPDGSVYYASLAAGFVGRIDIGRQGWTLKVLELPTPNQGARRVWSDSKGMIWVAEWNSGQLSRYDPKSETWRAWRPPGPNPQVYAVYVDERDIVWITDFGANAITSFDPVRESFTPYPLPSPNSAVRQLLGRPNEIWGAASGADKLVVIRTK